MVGDVDCDEVVCKMRWMNIMRLTEWRRELIPENRESDVDIADVSALDFYWNVDTWVFRWA